MSSRANRPTRSAGSQPAWPAQQTRVLLKSMSITTRPKSNNSASAMPGESRGGVIAQAPPSIAIGLDVQQRECAEDIGRSGRRGRVQIGCVEPGEIWRAEQAEAPDHFVFQQLQHPHDSLFTSRS